MNPPSQTQEAPGAHRSLLVTSLISLLLTTGLQWCGGAYEAEFCGAADEPAHLVSSLLVRDYVGVWPPPDPMPWAINYYLHYPKVALGHWPPGYFVLQAGWWLLFPPGRVSAMLFNAVAANAAALLFYVLASRIRPGWPALLCSGLLLVSPLLQQAAAQMMSDLPSLGASLAALLLLTRFIEQPSNRRLVAAVGAMAAALLIKGTAVALLPAAALAIAADRSWRRFRLAPLWLVAILATWLPAVIWYLWQNSAGTMELLRWGGVMAPIPWAIGYLPQAAGIGFLAMATAGMLLARRQPVILCAVAGMIGFTATSYVVRAFREPRHWIAALPLILLLALAAFAWLEKRHRPAAWAMATVCLVLFPFEFYRQPVRGFTALAAQLPRPGRFLISSPNGWSEGCFIAAVSLTEPRPSSTVLRATKVLARTNWNGNRYAPLISDAEGIERLLDEGAVGTVVAHTVAAEEPLFPHHELLVRTVRESSLWRRCGATGELEAYCRTAPARRAPKPQRIDLRQHIGREIEESVP
jgi:hypothetical protein